MFKWQPPKVNKSLASQVAKATGKHFLIELLNDVITKKHDWRNGIKAAIVDSQFALMTQMSDRVEYNTNKVIHNWANKLSDSELTQIRDWVQDIKEKGKSVERRIQPDAWDKKYAGYTGNPDSEDIYPTKINHGYDEPLAGGTDVMRRLQNILLLEQGLDPRPESPKLAFNNGVNNMKRLSSETIESKFEKGVPADPTENMSPEDAEKWEEMNDKYQDQLKKAISNVDKLSRFEEGKPVDVPEYLRQHGNPDAADEWEKMNEEYGEQFKTAEDSNQDTEKDIVQAFEDYKTASAVEDWKRTLDYDKKQLDWVQDTIKKLKEGVTIPGMSLSIENLTSLEKSLKEGIKTKEGILTKLKKTAAPAGGLYGYPRHIHAAVEQTNNQLQKLAKDLAISIHKKDPRVANFLNTHAKQSKSASAKILAQILKDVQVELNESDKTATKLGMYGMPVSTVKLGLSACNTLKEHAGRLSYGLYIKKAKEYDRIVGFLKQHSKEGRCLYSSMIHRYMPEKI